MKGRNKEFSEKNILRKVILRKKTKKKTASSDKLSAKTKMGISQLYPLDHQKEL